MDSELRALAEVYAEADVVHTARRDSVTHSLPKSTVIAGNPRVSLRPGSRINRGNPRYSDCLPCRRSWVRVPSAASEVPANRPLCGRVTPRIRPRVGHPTDTPRE